VNTVDTDVLIVGAGPVGLFLANECARRGLRWKLIETRTTQSEHSKALAVMPRTMEIFDMAGVVAPFLEIANRVTWVAVVEPSRTLARMHFAPEESPYPFVAMVPQDITEKLLVEALRRKGGGVDYETTFVSAVQEDERVKMTLDRKGARQDLTARFVVGCDGAHSAVRHLLNIPFEGEVYDASFMLADTETNEMLPADEMQLCPSASGPVAIFPMSSTRRRIVATVDQPEEEAPRLETVRKILVERGPRSLEARALKWSSYFRVHHRQVARLGVERIFLAGDAAHIHSPVGGQGMNTGLHDAWNLVWKLDFAVRGIGGKQLLESYSAERRPVIKQVIEFTHFMTNALATPSKLAQAVRDTVIPLVSRVAPFQRGMVERLSQLGITYKGSPIVEGAGKRYFHDALRNAGICGRFQLFVGGNADAVTEEKTKQLCDRLSNVVELRRAQNHGITLVRPDGYIAYEAPVSDGVQAIATVHSVLEKMLGLGLKLCGS
jgi:2-polyprenyl-6-methoxyphenol hydroxylase-like FAD-dependent oxidoreductase